MASLRFVSQKLISPTAQADLVSLLTTIQSSGVPASIKAINPYAAKAWNYFGVLYGNAFSGEQGFATVGSLSSTSNVAWDQNYNIVPWTSASKIMNGCVLVKLIEEGLVTSYDTLASQISTGFSGNMTYVQNSFQGTGAINVNSQPGNPAAWTVQTGTFNASTLTLNTLLTWNLGFTYDFYQYGYQGLAYTMNSTGSVLGDALAGVDYGKNLAWCNYKFNQWNFNNKALSFSYQAMTGALTVQAKQTMNAVLAALASGELALAWKPNTNARGGPNFGGLSTANAANTNVSQVTPYYLTEQLQAYSICMELLAYWIDNKLRSLVASDPVTYPAATYGNFAAYARAKILTPLQMNATYCLNQEQPSLGTPTPNIAALKYDPSAAMITPQIGRANLRILYLSSPTTYPELAYCNLLDATNEQNMTIAANYSAPTTGASLAWQILYGNNASNLTIATGAYGAIPYNVSDDSFAKSYYTIITKFDPTDCPFGGLPFAGPMTDLAKLIVCILNGGKNQAGQRVFNRQSIDLLLTPRTSPFSPLLVNTITQPILSNVLAGMGVQTQNPMQRYNNNDFFTSSCFVHPGSGGSYWVFDTKTGYYAIWATNLQTIFNATYNATGGYPGWNQICRLIMNKNA
jgi:hypothetical protein